MVVDGGMWMYMVDCVWGWCDVYADDGMLMLIVGCGCGCWNVDVDGGI